MLRDIGVFTQGNDIGLTITALSYIKYRQVGGLLAHDLVRAGFSAKLRQIQYLSEDESVVEIIEKLIHWSNNTKLIDLTDVFICYTDMFWDIDEALILPGAIHDAVFAVLKLAIASERTLTEPEAESQRAAIAFSLHYRLAYRAVGVVFSEATLEQAIQSDYKPIRDAARSLAKLAGHVARTEIEDGLKWLADHGRPEDNKQSAADPDSFFLRLNEVVRTTLEGSAPDDRHLVAIKIYQENPKLHAFLSDDDRQGNTFY